MANYYVKRLIMAVLVLLGATVFAFLVSHATGDPVNLMVPEGATEQQKQDLRVALGFNRPVVVQYLDFLYKALHGDLGTSLRQGQSVSRLIAERVPATLKLAFFALTLSIMISIPLGILAALNRGSIVDLLATSFSLSGQAIPSFWMGLMGILLFGVYLRILPISGSGTWKHLLMPVFTLAMLAVGRSTRLVRSSMLEVIGSDYVRTARGKGLIERTIIFRHMLRNALIPVVTLIGMEFGALMSGAFITEMVFAWPGMGRLAVNAVYERDFPLVQGVVLVSATIYVFVNLGVDILYTWLDPRISYR
jgi:ABC-type dipeptide/oligopeptide/nickel transport system permease component